MSRAKTNWKPNETGHIAEHNLIGVRLNQVYCVSDYGAVGDGTTDDTAAIQAALDAAGAARGGIVMIPPGIYQTSAPLVIPWRVTLMGHGYFTSVLRAASAIDGPMIQVSGQQYVSIRDIGIDGDSKAEQGIELTNTGNNHIDSVRVVNCVEDGLYIHGGVWISTIQKSLISTCGHHGIYILASADSQANIITCRDCTVMLNQMSGVRLVNGTNIGFDRCTIEFNGQGGAEQFGLYQTGAGQKLVVNDCYFERNGIQDPARGVNIRIGSDQDTAYICASIRDNYLFGGVDQSLSLPGECNYAIQLENTQDAIITGNYSYGHILSGMNLAGAKNLRSIEQGNLLN